MLIWTEAERFEAMARFYRDALGLTPRTSKPDFVNFDWGGVRLSVSVHDRVRGASADPFRIMVNLAVDDIARRRTRGSTRAGVVFTRLPETEDWGGRVAIVPRPRRQPDPAHAAPRLTAVARTEPHFGVH